MTRLKLALTLSLSGWMAYGQNDLDAIRYSRIGGGGSARFMSMGGAFGAIGADVSAAAYNPAGLAVFRKGEISLAVGLRSTNNSADIYKHDNSVFDLRPVFNNFGIVAAWDAGNDPESRHALAFTNTQLQNFHNSTRMVGYTNSSSIAKDMLNLASSYNGTYNMADNLNPMYEGLGYVAYMLEIDTTNNSFFSFLDPKRTVKQTRDLVTSGRANDLNFSYAYTYKDKFYIGASIGLPQINYESTTTHIEEDDRDSMQVILNNDGMTFTDTYVDPLPYLPAAYESRLGFRSLEYTEYFKTTGSGINLKLGGIYRVSDAFRVGFYYHTPTIFRLQDSYYNSLSVTFDRTGSTPDVAKEPADGGYFKYRVITPGRVSANIAVLFGKRAVIGLDYELVNYRGAQLASNDISDFDGVNSTIKTKYSAGHNLRLGGEINFNPWMIRLGYNMQGSPFGDVFTGDFVRNTFSAGFGLRTKSNFYFDVVAYQTVSNENYYLFTTLDTKSKISYKSTTFAATVGLKF